MAADESFGGTRRGVLAGAGALAFTASAPSGLAAVTASARDRLEATLARIADPAGEGARVYLTLYPAAARAAADAADARAKAGASLGPLDGAIVSIKDLFDVAGEPTRAGSKVLAGAPPATADAVVVTRLRNAGAVIVGKTNMVEFAFSGVGTNPHYGTPGNAADRARVPGGSSSGAGVAAADSLCEIAIGTDTGGSTRIPAALNGAVGYKPTKARVPTTGAFPLSASLDSVGPIARSVAACARADAVLAGDAPWTLTPAPLAGVKMAIPQGFTLADLDATVAARFAEALAALGKAGVRLSDQSFPLFDGMAQVNAAAPLVSVEAYAVHREMLATRGDDYDPFVRARIEAASGVSPAAYAQMLHDRRGLIEAMDARMADLELMVLPTTPITAPLTAEVATLESFTPKNRLLLRNTSMVNFFDLCAISVPLPRQGGLPVGLMLVARGGQDRRLFEVAAVVERLFA